MSHSVSRRFAALVIVAALAAAVPLILQTGTDHPSDHGPVEAQQAGESAKPPRSNTLQRRDPESDPHTWQTSDRVIGPSAPVIAGRLLARATRTELRFRYRLAPGVVARSYKEVSPRGKYRYFVVTAKWNKAGLAYAHPEIVAQTEPTRRLVKQIPNALAGVNGDFFDIGDTGAPLGVGVDRSGLVSGRTHGWNSAFYLDDAGVPRIGELPIVASLPGHPYVRITNVNSPQVMPGGIGVYTPDWGTTAGGRWVDGFTRGRGSVRMLRVVKGTVVEKRKLFPPGQTFEGQIVVARGPAAVSRLDKFNVGDSLVVEWGVAGDPRVAVTGNQIVLKDGKVLATDDRELHPRTAIGIDRKKRRLVLLVVDGRQKFSDGFTMVQVAKKLRQLGASAGLNLDGGGSTTMVALRDGKLKVINSPSGGVQRYVANGLVVTAPPAPPTKGGRR